MSVRRCVCLGLGAALTLSGCLGQPYDDPTTHAGPSSATATPSSPADPGLGLGAPTAPVPLPASTPLGAAAATRLLAQVRARLRGWTSVHATGTLNREGVPMAFDLVGTRDGGAVRGTVSVGAAPAVEVVRVGGVSYVRTRSVAQGSRFVRMSGDPLTVLSLPEVVGAVSTVLDGSGHPQVSSAEAFEGRPAAVVALSPTSTLVVAADGTGDPLRLSTGSGEDVSTIGFDSWDKAAPVTAPPTGVQTSVPGG